MVETLDQLLEQGIGRSFQLHHPGSGGIKLSCDVLAVDQRERFGQGSIGGDFYLGLGRPQ